MLQIIPFVRADYEFENNVPNKFEGEQELEILNIKHRTQIIDNDNDPIKKLQKNRIHKKYNV